MPTEVQIYRDGTIVGADIDNKTITAAQLAVGAVIPTGGIIMWSGTIANIPTGWALCNGTNGTPNLQDRFIVGATSGGDGVYPGVGVNQTGGNKDAIIPYHNHTDAGHTHNYDPGINSPDNNPLRLQGNDLNTPRYGGQTRTTGTGHANISYAGTANNQINANLPPYYALAFIMKT